MAYGLITSAAIQGLTGLTEGLFGNASRERQAAADRALQSFVAQQNAANNIMGLNASLGQGMSNNRWSNVLGPDLDQARQFTAAKQKFDILAPKENALNRENARWSIGASLDPSSREAGFQAFLNENRKANTAANIGMQGLFGKSSNYLFT